MNNNLLGNGQSTRETNSAGVKPPDFVLVYKKDERCDNSSGNKKRRENFEKCLKETGLRVEKCDQDPDKDHEQMHIYATDDVLYQYADMLKLRCRIKDEFQNKISPKIEKNKNWFRYWIIDNIIKLFVIIFRLQPDKKLFPEEDHIVTTEFKISRRYLFDNDINKIFKQSDRIMIVNYILETVEYEHLEETIGDEDVETRLPIELDASKNVQIGIKKLISDKVYTSAYPIHDAEMQENLIKEWGSYSKFTKNQPLDAIKDYFGVKIALYFAWLKFYTNMLIIASIPGIGCVILGAMTISQDPLSKVICDPDKNITMCPLCDGCDYWNLTDACLYSEFTHTFDNYATLAFAVFMSVWSAFFLNSWKNYSARLVHRWGLLDLSPDKYYPRPEYLAKLKKMIDLEKKNLKIKKDKITDREEPQVPWTIKVPIRIFSAACALFSIAIMLFTMIIILVFRLTAIISEEMYGETDADFKTLAIPATAAVLDLIVILILNSVYQSFALWLTEKEFHRTQNEFDDSLTLKVFTFQFINYYAGFFYIAFIKGRITGYPGGYRRFMGRRLEECSPGGCLMELCIQLSIVMIGDQLWGGFLEYVIPVLNRYWNKYKKRQKQISSEVDGPTTGPNPKKTEDYFLQEWDARGLFDEYLEMVVQYGFVTLFVTAFPLAPLFALINNVIEIRGDAKKFLRDFRRPVAQTVKNIGVWLKIIDIIGKLAVLSNGFIIAFSSNFIPRMVYDYIESDQAENYIIWSLSSFNTTEFQNGTGPSNPSINASICYYPDFRWPHNHENRYSKSKKFWHIFAARLTFVLIYQHLIFILKMLLKYLMPANPKSLKLQILKEQWKLCKIITEHEKNISQRGNNGRWS